MEAADILLGLGGDVDYELHWDQAHLQDQVRAWGVTRDDVGQREIVDQTSLLGSICDFMSTGSGGERPVASPAILETFVAGYDWVATVGGTAPRAAAAMARVGVPGTLHLTTMNDTMRALLPPGFEWVSSSAEEHLYPHVIVQYPPGGWVELTDGYRVDARVANRGIYVYDPDNADLAIVPEYPELVARARLVLVSGLNGLASEELLARRLAQVSAGLDRAAPGAIIMLEEAGYHRADLGEVVRAALSPRTTVHSMNAEEFVALAGLPGVPPNPADLIRSVAALHDRLGTENLVVHSPEWALAHGPLERDLRPGLELGMALATVRYTHGDTWQADDVDTLTTCPLAQQGIDFVTWAGDRADLAVVAGHVVDAPRPTTIGLGDTFVGGFLAGLALSRAGVVVASAAPGGS